MSSFFLPNTGGEREGGGGCWLFVSDCPVWKFIKKRGRREEKPLFYLLAVSAVSHSSRLRGKKGGRKRGAVLSSTPFASNTLFASYAMEREREKGRKRGDVFLSSAKQVGGEKKRKRKGVFFCLSVSYSFASNTSVKEQKGKGREISIAGGRVCSYASRVEHP